MNKFICSLLSVLLLGNPIQVLAVAEPGPVELQQIETLQRRAEKLSFGETGANSFLLSKARAWLDMALSEYYEKDTSGLLAAAIEQAGVLLDALDNSTSDIGMEMPIQVPGSAAIRPDLQEQINALKQHAHFACGQRPLGTAEVYLVWAGHEFHESGQSHAEPYLRTVENLIYDAQVAIENCTAAPAVVQAPPLEKITLSGDALFAFNKTRLNPAALGQLDKLADSIKAVTELDEVILIGHTDRMRSDGRHDLNQQLSERRAESIKQYLIGKGIPEAKIHASGAGSSKPVVECSDQLGKAKQIACLQPNRRVEIILRGTR
jgi:outer membrane protein OmpA-like peptidoglycan-associated protein